MILKVSSNRIKNLSLSLISSIQNTLFIDRFVSKGGRLKSDILEMTHILNMEGSLLTIDIEKTFDSIDYYFLLAILEKYGLKESFLK